MSKKKKWTKEQFEANRLKYIELKSTSEIAEIMKLSTTSIGRLLRSQVEFQEQLRKCKQN